MSTIQVLIVDDNELNREVIAEYIETEDCQFDMAEDGQEAVELATDKKYDVILMDIMMPVLDGVSATQKIRQIQGDNGIPPKIVAVTAKELRENVETFAKAGFNEYVAKPFTESEIIRAINPFVNPGNEVGEWAHF